MDYIYVLIAIMAGIGVFLIGCKMMSDSIEKLATNKIRNLFMKTSQNKLIGVGVGTVTTAIVQSSTAVTVMVVGLVNTGIMSLTQATAVIIGANIGTTITGVIVAFQAYDFAKFAIGFAGVGMLISFCGKKEKTKTIGLAFTGLGLIFVALELLSDAMSDVRDIQFIEDMLINFTNPFLLFLFGTILTFVIQSSTALTTIMISMAGAGLIIGGGGNAVLYVILGTNVGTCGTALLSSIEANTNAKRASMIHLIYNVLGSVIVLVMLLFMPRFNELTFEKWFREPGMQIAMFHVWFNVIGAVAFYPFMGGLVKLSMILVKDTPAEPKHTYLEKRFLHTPSIAIEASVKETMRLLDMAIANLNKALDSFITTSLSLVEEVKSSNEDIYELGKEITNYLILISSNNVSLSDEKHITIIHDSISDIVRISELADNIMKYTDRTVKENLVFSNAVSEQINNMRELIIRQSKDVSTLLINRDYKIIKEINLTEDLIDNLRKDAIAEHIERLNKGECKADSSSVFINLFNNLERVGDHLYFMAEYMNQIKVKNKKVVIKQG